MPYKIIGKIVGDDGYPIYQSALIEELNNQGVQIASVLSDQETGDFVFFAEYETSIVRISSPGYKPQTFTAKNVPNQITVTALDESIINAKRPTVNKTGLVIALGVLAVVAFTAVALQKNDNTKKAQAQPKAAPAKKLPAKTTSKPRVTPKTVTV